MRPAGQRLTTRQALLVLVVPAAAGARVVRRSSRRAAQAHRVAGARAHARSRAHTRARTPAAAVGGGELRAAAIEPRIDSRGKPCWRHILASRAQGNGASECTEYRAARCDDISYGAPQMRVGTALPKPSDAPHRSDAAALYAHTHARAHTRAHAHAHAYRYERTVPESLRTFIRRIPKDFDASVTLSRSCLSHRPAVDCAVERP